MIRTTIKAGVCGFTTIIKADCEDGQTVSLSYESDCPNVVKAAADFGPIDAYAEIFSKPAASSTYTILSKYLPHTACPLYSGFFKAIEAAAGLALPRDVSMVIEPMA
jgi:hypothetical protein